MVKIDPKFVASAAKVVIGVTLISAGTLLQKEGMKELGRKLTHNS